MERFWENPVNVKPRVGIFVDVEPLHEGKQSKLMHTNEWFGSCAFPFRVGIGLCLGDKGVMKVRNGGHVPGAAGHGTYEKTARVVDNVCNNHSDNIQGKSDGGGRRCPLGRSVRRTHPPDSGLTSVPNSLAEQLDRCI